MRIIYFISMYKLWNSSSTVSVTIYIRYIRFTKNNSVIWKYLVLKIKCVVTLIRCLETWNWVTFIFVFLMWCGYKTFSKDYLISYCYRDILSLNISFSKKKAVRVQHRNVSLTFKNMTRKCCLMEWLIGEEWCVILYLHDTIFRANKACHYTWYVRRCRRRRRRRRALRPPVWVAKNDVFQNIAHYPADRLQCIYLIRVGYFSSFLTERWQLYLYLGSRLHYRTIRLLGLKLKSWKGEFCILVNNWIDSLRRNSS